jgi:hypothetical protein
MASLTTLNYVNVVAFVANVVVTYGLVSFIKNQASRFRLSLSLSLSLPSPFLASLSGHASHIDNYLRALSVGSEQERTKKLAKSIRVLLPQLGMLLRFGASFSFRNSFG